MFNKEILKNGLRVITIPMTGVKSMTVLFVVGAGSRYEDWEISGLAHFAEHMFFKGTYKRPTTLDISSLIDGIGGEFNAFTSKEYAGYYVKAASNHFEVALDVLSDMLLNSKSDPKEIDRERGVILEEMRMYKDMPNRYVGTLYDSLIFGNHPLGWDVVGHEHSIAKVAREDFLNYRRSLYVPKNVILGVAGDFDKNLVLALAEKYWGGLELKQNRHFLPYQSNQTKQAVKLLFKETEQAHFSLGVRSYPLGHPKHFVLSVLSNILGGSMSSRLFIELRERRGLGYYIRTSLEEYTDCGTLLIQAGVVKEKIEEAMKVCLEEFSKVANQEVSPEELNKAKENLKGKLILELEDSREVAALYLLQEILEEKIKTPPQIIKEIDSVTPDQVKSTAVELFKEQTLNLAIIGPYKDEGGFLNLLKF